MKTSRELRDQRIDLGHRLLSFNWLVAGYAHKDWLDEWAPVLTPRQACSARLLWRASRALLLRQGLQDRYLREAADNSWLLLPREQLLATARQLGVAMLGGWVRGQLERRQVALQLQLLGEEGRAQALSFACTLKALPFAPRALWGLDLTQPSALLRVGLGGLAGLLQDPATGARERLQLGFARGMVQPLALSHAQCDEALAVIHGLTPPPLPPSEATA